MNRTLNDDGFSLVELLVVVVIIAILAAISMASLLEQRKRAFIGDVQSTLRNAAASAQGIATANGGSFASLSPATLDAEGLRVADSQVLTVPLATTSAYCIQVVDDRLTGHPDWSSGHFSSVDGKPEAGDC